MMISARISTRFGDSYAPRKTMNSDQNELRLGRPSDAKNPMASTRENCGITFARPWSSGMSRVPVACLTEPASMNRIAVMMPWLNNWKIPPWTPNTVRLEAPRRTKPMCPIELGETNECRVDHRHRPEHCEHPPQALCGIGEDSEVDAKEPVPAHLQEDAREEDGASGRGLDVSVREPGMEGEGGELHEEANQEGREDRNL